MSRTVKDYMDFVKNVRDAIPNQTEGIIKRNEQLILDLNRQYQLMEGLDSNGNSGTKIFPKYRPFTIEIKRNIGQPYDRVTLFHNGDFYKSFNIEIDKNNHKITILAKDNKTPALVKKYGKNILGLTDQNQNILNKKIILPELLKYIKQWL